MGCEGAKNDKAKKKKRSKSAGIIASDFIDEFHGILTLWGSKEIESKHKEICP